VIGGGHPAHLVRRFFGSLRSRRPSPGDQLLVGALLRPKEAELFWAQPVPDQAHGMATARAVMERRPERPDLARAALLHDVGKRRCGLGVIGRSIASALALAHIPTWGRYTMYLDHGTLGAEDLENAGSDDLTIGFARDHHGEPPDGIDLTDWAFLVEADSE
jgi:hypothetical protein